MVSYGSTPTERATMARALALLFAAGGALVLLTLALPRAADADVAGLLTPALLAFAVAGALVTNSSRASVGVLQVALVGGSVLITACVAAAGSGAEIYPSLYVLVSCYAFFFLSPRAAMRQIAVVGVLYAAALLSSADVRLEEGSWVA